MLSTLAPLRGEAAASRPCRQSPEEDLAQPRQGSTVKASCLHPLPDPCPQRGCDDPQRRHPRSPRCRVVSHLPRSRFGGDEVQPPSKAEPGTAGRPGQAGPMLPAGGRGGQVGEPPERGRWGKGHSHFLQRCGVLLHGGVQPHSWGNKGQGSTVWGESGPTGDTAMFCSGTRSSTALAPLLQGPLQDMARPRSPPHPSCASPCSSQHRGGGHGWWYLLGAHGGALTQPPPA